MVTFVGTQSSLIDAVTELVELEQATISAYSEAITRLENFHFKEKMQEFKQDHLRHLGELSAVLRRHNIEVPDHNGMINKEMLTKGKVVIAGLVSDDMILSAMLSNEGDTNHAYERMTTRDDCDDELKEILERGYQDERRHKAWLENYK